MVKLKMVIRSAKRPIKHIPSSNANPTAKGFHWRAAIFFVVVFAAEGEQKPDEKNSPLQWKPLSRRVSVADLGCSSLWTRIMLLVRVRVRVIFKMIF